MTAGREEGDSERTPAMTATYIAVVVLQAAIILGLWLLGRAFA